MRETLEIVLSALGMFAIYGSSLLFWPVQLLLYRHQTERGRALRWMFLAQVLLYGAWCVIAWRLDEWLDGLILVWPMNLLFWCVGLIIWLATAETKVLTDDAKTG
jgi:hypothetical protein